MNLSDEWIKEGEALMRAFERGEAGVTWAIIFRLGAWWADRPWRTK